MKGEIKIGSAIKSAQDLSRKLFCSCPEKARRFFHNMAAFLWQALTVLYLLSAIAILGVLEGAVILGRAVSYRKRQRKYLRRVRLPR